MTSRARPTIALLAAPESSAFVLYGLFDVLSSVGAVFPDMTTGRPGEALLDVRIVSATGVPFRCFGDVPVEPHAALADLPTPDVAIVCDLYTPIDTPPVGRYPAEIAWLRAAHAAGTLVASVCSGSLVLAESGLLDGRSCTGHWAYRDLVRRQYPAVRFAEASILDRSAEAEGVITAGGVTAWQDLALHLIGRLVGPAQASATAKVYLLAGHEDGQLPFSAMVRAPSSGDAVIRDVLAWIDGHSAVANPVTAMTVRSGLTPRTFARRFAAATGRTPMGYVHELRMEAARSLIEAGATSADDVAAEVGYEDPTFFRRLFKRTTGLTPAAYRRKYAAVTGVDGGS